MPDPRGPEGVLGEGPEVREVSVRGEYEIGGGDGTNGAAPATCRPWGLHAGWEATQIYAIGQCPL